MSARTARSPNTRNPLARQKPSGTAPSAATDIAPGAGGFGTGRVPWNKAHSPPHRAARWGPGEEARNRLSAPGNAVIAERQFGAAAAQDLARPGAQLTAQRTLRRRLQQTRGIALGRVGNEAEAVELADQVTLDLDRAV